MSERSIKTHLDGSRGLLLGLLNNRLDDGLLLLDLRLSDGDNLLLLGGDSGLSTELGLVNGGLDLGGLLGGGRSLGGGGTLRLDGGNVLLGNLLLGTLLGRRAEESSKLGAQATAELGEVLLLLGLVLGLGLCWRGRT
jgi:hypothetical protein